VTKAKFGKPVPLLVEAKGFPDGRAVIFEIWKEVGGKKDKIDEIFGSVRREKGIGQWEPKIKREATLSLSDKVASQPEKEKYGFIAFINKGEDNEKKVQGSQIEFTYRLALQLFDVAGKPIDEAKFTITFSDKNKKNGVLKNGLALIDNVPGGVFIVELEEYDFK
jgi:hypothetical protein